MDSKNLEEAFIWLQDKLDGLSEDSNRKNILLEIRSAAGSLDGNALQTLVSSVQLGIVFDCLNSSDNEQIELATAVLSTFISYSNKSDILNKYASSIGRALKHPSHVVKRTFLQRLEDCLDEDSLASWANRYSDLTLTAIECISSSDLSVAQASMSLVKKIGKHQIFLKNFYSDPILTLLKSIMNKDDIVRFRVYDVIIDISCTSMDHLKLCHDCGILSSLLLELKSTDCLLQLNALQLLTTLVAKQHGLSYLQQKGTIEYLAKKVINVYDEPMPFIILPGLIHFFGNLITLNPHHISSQYPDIIRTLFESIERADDDLLSVLISTVGHIGSTNEGKLLLDSLNENMVKFFNKISSILNSQNEVRVIALKTLSILISVEKNDMLTEELIVKTENWFKQLGPDNITQIMNIVKLPFVEQRLSALELLSNIAKQPWGICVLGSYPGFAEYLLDRSTETDKDCKHAKYELVQNVMNSDKIDAIVGRETYLRMQQFLAEGPFYVQAQPEMAFEGST